MEDVIAAMESNQSHLTTAKSFYVEISRARDWAELVTDDAGAFRDRVSVLDGIGESAKTEKEMDGKIVSERKELYQDHSRLLPLESVDEKKTKPNGSLFRKTPVQPTRSKWAETDLGL